jgi:hypothetical protein
MKGAQAAIMTGKSTEMAELGPAARRAAERRAERLAAALRANLGRRKSQARERDEGPLAEAEPAIPPAQPSPSRGED